MNQFQQKHIVIVDGLFSGRYYAPFFLAHGYLPIHVNTGLYQHEELPLHSPCYLKEIHMHGKKSICDVVDQLKPFQIQAIVPGSEVGILTTEALQQHFTLTSNVLTMGPVRRDKFLMIEALRKQGIPCAVQHKSESIHDIITWYKQSGLKKVVLKPTLSADSEGVAICHNVKEIQQHYSKFHNKVNLTGEKNEFFTLQECLEGDEYIVNSVTCHGKHFVTDIWKGVGGLKDQISTDEYADLLRRDSHEFSILSHYVERVLDAVGITNSAGHSEIKLTPDGPKLIEVGARLAGQIDFSVIHAAIGYSQFSLSASSILYPQHFITQMRQLGLSKQPYCRFIYSCSEISGMIVKEPDFSPMMALDSVKSITSKKQKGDYLPITNETHGRPGYAMLVSDTEEKLEEDYQTFRSLERALYQNIIAT